MPTTLVSRSERFAAVAQDDGNFVVYPRRPDGSLDQEHPVWDEWSHGGSPAPLPDPPDPPAEPRPSADPPPTGPIRLIRITGPADGRLINRGQSYWAQCWIRERDQQIFCFVGSDSGRPLFYQIDRRTRRVERLGSLLNVPGEGEGWYWDAEGLITYPSGPILRRVDPFQVVISAVLLDITDRFPGCDLWQAHSSDDGTVQSATVRQIVAEGPYPKIGTIVSQRGQIRWFPVEREPLDESAIDASGRWLLIKEGPGPDNKIVDLQTGSVRWIADGNRAMGHSDMGWGFVVGEADKPDPGQCGLIDLASLQYRALFNTLNMGHVSVRGRRCLLSSPDGIERLDLATGIRRRLLEAATQDDAGLQASLDPTGQVAIYLTDTGGRLDAFLLDLGGV